MLSKFKYGYTFHTQLCRYLEKKWPTRLVNALVISKGLPLKLVRKAQRVQKVAARLIISTSRYEHTYAVLAHLLWPPVGKQEYKTVDGVGLGFQ